MFLISAFLVLFFISPPAVLAESSYVLPYPSSMPGSKFYVLHLAWEKIMRYWYMGNLSQFTYNLKFADKYLVEAKTLFEYKQYYYAYRALLNSDRYFINAYPYLLKAKKDGVNIADKEDILREGGRKHSELLLKIKQEVPNEFIWAPENGAPTKLFIWESIDKSINIRTNYK